MHRVSRLRAQGRTIHLTHAALAPTAHHPHPHLLLLLAFAACTRSQRLIVVAVIVIGLGLLLLLLGLHLDRALACSRVQTCGPRKSSDRGESRLWLRSSPHACPNCSSRPLRQNARAQHSPACNRGSSTHQTTPQALHMCEFARGGALSPTSPAASQLEAARPSACVLSRCIE